MSSVDGRIRITGQSHRGPKGDGSIAHVFVDGREILARKLGGGQSLIGKFDVQTSVRAGTRVDFAVDSGPAPDTAFDDTRFTVAIERLEAMR